MKKSFLFSLTVILTLSACSLNYDGEKQADIIVPEFIFSDVELLRYEDNKVSVEFNAKNLEQYKGSSESYAKGVKFSSYDSYGELTTNGECGYLAADTDKEIYTLYDDIKVYNKSNDINFFSNSLKWDSKTEQLTSGRSDIVRVEKDNTTIYGSGFSASGISKSFRFSGAVSGEILTKEEKQDGSETDEESVE